jgi:predicted enzyme related to lactoylglutathione lyase
MGAPVTFFEITALDLEVAGAFYEALFGWEVVAAPGGYRLIDTGEGVGLTKGGITQAVNGTRQTTVFVTVDDLRASIGMACELGGRLLRSPRELPRSLGSIARIADPAGQELGLWSAGP